MSERGPSVSVSVPIAQAALLEPTMSPTAALTAMKELAYGVVRLADGGVLSVVERADLDLMCTRSVAQIGDPAAGLPPGVTLRDQTPLPVLAGDDAVTLLDLLGRSAMAAVADEDGRVLGLFDVSVFDAYLAAGGRVLDNDVLGAAGFSRDGQAIGRIRVGLACVVCARCGRINTLLPPVDVDDLGPCANTEDGGTHALILAMTGEHGG
jgi:hypothetical protein